MKLSKLHQRFADEYLKDLNATAAYKRAGYKTKKGPSTENAASRLLGNVRVKAYITKRQEELQAKVETDQEMIVREYKRLGFYDPRKFFNADGTARSIQDLDDESASALAGMEVTELMKLGDESKGISATVKKFKLADKLHALDSLAKHLGMFKELGSSDNPVQVNVTIRSVA